MEKIKSVLFHGIHVSRLEAPESLIYNMNEISKQKFTVTNVSKVLLSSRVILESVNKRKEGTHAGDVKSKVMAEIYSCEIKPVCTLMIKDLGYTSVDKSLRTCEHFDTSIYLQDRRKHDERRRNVA